MNEMAYSVSTCVMLIGIPILTIIGCIVYFNLRTYRLGMHIICTLETTEKDLSTREIRIELNKQGVQATSSYIQIVCRRLVAAGCVMPKRKVEEVSDYDGSVETRRASSFKVLPNAQDRWKLEFPYLQTESAQVTQ